MSGRTPSFIVVGLVIIMFLLGLFYMSCSSKNNELRVSLEQFEDRIRSLTMKNSDSDKKYENLNSRKRELEEDKLTIQRQMEKKDSEINDLNTKLNEKISELKSLSSDKKVVDEQLKEYKSLSETIAAKNSLIEKLQQQLEEQKQSNNDELTRLKNQYETVKTKQSPENNQLPSNNEKQNNFIIPPQRFRPFIPNNYTTKSIASLFQDPLNKLNNLTKEVKPQIIQTALDIKEKVLDAFGVNTNATTSTITNQQQDINNDKQQQANQNVLAPPLANNDKQQQEVDQNVPAPPLADNAQRQQQPDHVESAQAAPKQIENNQAVAGDNSQYQKELQRSLHNSIADNKNVKLSNINEIDDEEQPDFDNVQEDINPIKENFKNNNQLIDSSLLERSNKKSSRLGNRKQYRKTKNRVRQEQQIDNGEEMDGANNEQDRHVRKRRLF